MQEKGPPHVPCPSSSPVVRCGCRRQRHRRFRWCWLSTCLSPPGMTTGICLANCGATPVLSVLRAPGWILMSLLNLAHSPSHKLQAPSWNSLAALPPPLQRAFHSDPEASQAGSLSAEHLGGMTAAPPPASAYIAPGEATPPPRGRALPSTTLIGFVGCGGGRMPPPSGVAGFRRGGRRALPPLGCRVCCLGRGLGSGSGSGFGDQDAREEGQEPPP